MKIIATILLLQIYTLAAGQITLPRSGKASVSEQIGITTVKINYDRPAVKGREGKIWGQLVHYGFADLHYGTSKAAPWRAGANENTTIEFNTDVFIENKALPAGKYGFFIAMGAEKATLIFSTYNTAWGSFYYDAKDDALRVDVPVLRVDSSVERLKYEFDNTIDTSSVISLKWEKVEIPFKVSVNLPKLQIESFRREFNSGEFYQYWQNMNTAARYCLENNINLEEGLSWSERSINTYFGEANFNTLSTYAGLLGRLNRKKESDSVMQKALPMGKSLDLLQYGVSLNKMNRHSEAMKIFDYNFDNNTSDEYSYLGKVMGHYYLKNNAEAIKYAEMGKKAIANPAWKSYFDSLISDLKSGKEIFK